MYDNECHLIRPRILMRYSDIALRKPTNHTLTPVWDEGHRRLLQSFNTKILTKVLVKLRECAPKQTSARKLWPGTLVVHKIGLMIDVTRIWETIDSHRPWVQRTISTIQVVYMGPHQMIDLSMMIALLSTPSPFHSRAEEWRCKGKQDVCIGRLR